MATGSWSVENGRDGKWHSWQRTGEIPMFTGDPHALRCLGWHCLMHLHDSARRAGDWRANAGVVRRPRTRRALLHAVTQVCGRMRGWSGSPGWKVSDLVPRSRRSLGAAYCCRRSYPRLHENDGTDHHQETREGARRSPGRRRLRYLHGEQSRRWALDHLLSLGRWR